MPVQERDMIRADQPPVPKEKEGNWLEKTSGNLMIVATVIASMAFQAAVQTPNQLWKNNSPDKHCSAGTIWDDLINKGIADARDSAINCIEKYRSQIFVICNTVSFSASLSIILLLTVLPLKHKISLWILVIGMSITLVFMAATYIISLSLAEGSKQDRFENQILVYYVVFWILMLALVIIFFVLQILFWILKKLITSIYHAIKFIFRRRKQLPKSEFAEPAAATVV